MARSRTVDPLRHSRTLVTFSAVFVIVSLCTLMWKEHTWFMNPIMMNLTVMLVFYRCLTDPRRIVDPD